jgi:predicted metal-binding membrane protein
LLENKPLLASTALLCALAWAYVVYLASAMSAGAMSAMPGMPDMPGMAATMPNVQPWSLVDFGAMFAMWAVMMVAMMLPSATPMILLYERVGRHRASTARPAQSVWIFVSGYILAWAGFSLVATLANWALHSGGLLSAMMGNATPRVGGTVLLIAGIYQWTPLKHACLTHCRSPIGFLGEHWRDGSLGALRMGLYHGTYCVGCCWLLMALLFVLGVMNLVWIAVLTVFVLVEKAAPYGTAIGRAGGVAMIAWGLWLTFFVA